MVLFVLTVLQKALSRQSKGLTKNVSLIALEAKVLLSRHSKFKLRDRKLQIIQAFVTCF